MKVNWSKRSLFGFLLIWAPLFTLLGALLLAVGRMGFLDVVLQAPPLVFVFAIIARSALYTARALPIRKERSLRVVTIHSVSAVLASALWVGVTWGFGRSLNCFGENVIPVGSGPELMVVFVVGVLAYAWTVTTVYLWLAVSESKRAEDRVAEARSLALNAELKALRAQLNPHFLFNSLNSIAALTSIDSKKARKMTVALADFLRRSLSLGNRKTIRLLDELELIQAYLSVEAIRFEDKMVFEEEVDEMAGTAVVPPLLLQPLIENAVKYGIAEMEDTGFIHLKIHIEKNMLHICVSNPMAPNTGSPVKKGHGLRIVQKRLENHYGHAASFSVTRKDDPETMHHVCLTLPMNEEVVL